jgi:hypothetical protein
LDLAEVADQLNIPDGWMPENVRGRVTADQGHGR